MTAGFIWTARRSARLRELMHEGLSPEQIAARIGEGCAAIYVRIRMREMGATPVRPPATPALTTVPRPPAPRRPGLIDLSGAPSMMERRFGKSER